MLNNVSVFMILLPQSVKSSNDIQSQVILRNDTLPFD